VADVDGVHTESLAEKPMHDGRLQMADFRVAFSQLTDEQREALLLVGASGFSYEEAAQMCGVAVGTIKSRTGRGRQRLAELMDLNEEETLEMTDDTTLSVLSATKAAAS
jgi:RNA polymerase sigma-70 factor (ECF subfamily)